MFLKHISCSLIAAFLPVALAMGTSSVRAQPAPQPQGPQDPYDPDDDDVDEPDDAAPEQSGPAEAAPVQPPTAPPRAQPPAPPPAPPPVQLQAQPQQPAPAPQSATGQWVYTQQYGWVWAPYGDQYVYTPNTESAYPSEYVYTPAYGWSWIVAPWIWGWGPRVYFSVGPRYYGWFHRPHFVGRGFIGRGAVVHGFHGFRGGIRGGFGGGGHFSGGHFSGGHSGGGHFGGGHSGGHHGHR
jgi:hypothetical protein